MLDINVEYKTYYKKKHSRSAITKAGPQYTLRQVRLANVCNTLGCLDFEVRTLPMLVLQLVKVKCTVGHLAVPCPHKSILVHTRKKQHVNLPEIYSTPRLACRLEP